EIEDVVACLAEMAFARPAIREFDSLDRLRLVRSHTRPTAERVKTLIEEISGWKPDFAPRCSVSDITVRRTGSSRRYSGAPWCGSRTTRLRRHGERLDHRTGGRREGDGVAPVDAEAVVGVVR